MIWFKELVECMPTETFLQSRSSWQQLWDENAYSSVYHLMQQPWFRRRWVVQEVVASPDPLVVYGTQVLPWSVFSEALVRIGWLFGEQTFKPGLQLQPPELVYDPSLVWAVSHLRDLGVGSSSDLRFVDLLHSFRHTGTSNPLDRIYSLLGLCKPAVRAGNRPDYGISISDALVRLTVNHISVNNDLDILCIATTAARIRRPTEPYWDGYVKIFPIPAGFPDATFLPDLPSWAPNLTSYHSEWTLGRDYDMLMNPDFASLFDASLGVPPEVQNLDTCRLSKTLALSAIEIDEIVAVKQYTPVPSPEWMDSQAEIFGQLWAFAKLHWNPPTSYPTSLALLTAFFRTISAGGRRFNSRDILTDAFLRHFCVRFFSPAPFGQLLISEFGLEAKPPLEEQYEDPSAGAKYNDNSTLLFTQLGSHVFASTKSGRMVLVPILTQPGDRIFVLYGCTSPLLLRANPKQAGYYQNNGEAYMHGFMYGEAIRDEKNGLLTKQTIILE